jgi:hypothetical protein
MLPKSSINMHDCGSSVLTLCYDNWDYECTAELLENPLERILDDTDSGLEKIMYIYIYIYKIKLAIASVKTIFY